MDTVTESIFDYLLGSNPSAEDRLNSEAQLAEMASVFNADLQNPFRDNSESPNRPDSELVQEDSDPTDEDLSMQPITRLASLINVMELDIPFPSDIFQVGTDSENEDPFTGPIPRLESPVKEVFPLFSKNPRFMTKEEFEFEFCPRPIVRLGSPETEEVVENRSPSRTDRNAAEFLESFHTRRGRSRTPRRLNATCTPASGTVGERTENDTTATTLSAIRYLSLYHPEPGATPHTLSSSPSKIELPPSPTGPSGSRSSSPSKIELPASPTGPSGPGNEV